VWLHSEPQLLATATAYGSGRIALTVRVPASTPVGAHSIVVLAPEAEVQGVASLQVTALTLSATGVALGGIIGLAVVLLLGGAALLGMRRREADAQL